VHAYRLADRIIGQLADEHPADQRRAISAFGVGLAPSATESTPEGVQHEISVSLGIVGRNGWGTCDKPLP